MAFWLIPVAHKYASDDDAGVPHFSPGNVVGPFVDVAVAQAWINAKPLHYDARVQTTEYLLFEGQILKSATARVMCADCYGAGRIKQGRWRSQDDYVQTGPDLPCRQCDGTGVIQLEFPPIVENVVTALRAMRPKVDERV